MMIPGNPSTVQMGQLRDSSQAGALAAAVGGGGGVSEVGQQPGLSQAPSSPQAQPPQVLGTEPQFGEVLKRIQGKYGERAAPLREIKKTLGKDDFLRMMVAQMKNQDPTNPFKAEQMASEIAQFTSVEQLQNMNQGMKQLAQQNKPLEQMTMTHMIGKKVTLDRERFVHLAGENDVLSFQLPRNAESLNLKIINEAGEMVFEKEMGPHAMGETTFVWDGLQNNHLPAKGGHFLYRVQAQDQKGLPLELNPQGEGVVVGVNFQGAEPVFLVGNPAQPEKVVMSSIIKIEAAAAVSAVVAGAAATAATAPATLAGKE